MFQPSTASCLLIPSKAALTSFRRRDVRYVMLALWMAAVTALFHSGIEHNAAYRINRRSA